MVHWQCNSWTILNLHKVPESLSHCICVGARRLFQRHGDSPIIVLPAKAVSMPGPPAFHDHALECRAISCPCSIDVHSVSALDHTSCRTLKMHFEPLKKPQTNVFRKTKQTHMESGHHNNQFSHWTINYCSPFPTCLSLY